MFLLGTAVQDIQLPESIHLPLDDFGVGYPEGSYCVLMHNLRDATYDNVSEQAKLVVVADGVDVLCSKLFYKFQELKKLVCLENSDLECVGEKCFQYSKIEEIQISGRRLKIELKALYDCYHLKVIWVEDISLGHVLENIDWFTAVLPAKQTIVAGLPLWKLRSLNEVSIPDGINGL